MKTAEKLRKRLIRLGITYNRAAADDGDSFPAAFAEDQRLTGKAYTVGIAGNNGRLRHRIRRAFSRTGCFSKKLFNHGKAFSITFHYINYGSFDLHHTLWITTQIITSSAVYPSF